MADTRSLNCEVALVYLDRQDRSWPPASIVVQPQIIQLGGQDFLTGYAMAGEGTWAHNRRIHYRLSAVDILLEFDTLQEYDAWKSHLHPSA